ncbi:hypothetical protein [Bdellovibrio sp.]|uniref:hypothetical protein n=1 Tax=Bdellovibrio sp. TaxID=28201 RepID=UPI0039E3660B
MSFIQGSMLCLICGLLMSGCASVVPYKETNVTSLGIQVAIGEKDNVHVNDKIVLLERKCRETPKAPICGLVEVGKLTVKEVHETYSLVVPDAQLIFKEGQYFKFAVHCENENEACRSEK